MDMRALFEAVLTCVAPPLAMLGAIAIGMLLLRFFYEKLLRLE